MRESTAFTMNAATLALIVAAAFALLALVALVCVAINRPAGRFKPCWLHLAAAREAVDRELAAGRAGGGAPGFRHGGNRDQFAGGAPGGMAWAISPTCDGKTWASGNLGAVVRLGVLLALPFAPETKDQPLPEE